MDSATAEWNDVVGIEIATILGAQAGAQRLSIIIDRFLSRGSTFSATLPTENLVASLSLGGISCDAGKVRPVDSTGAGGGLVGGVGSPLRRRRDFAGSARSEHYAHLDEFQVW